MLPYLVQKNETALLPYLVQKMQYAISSAEFFFCFSYINTLQFSIRLILLLFTLFNFKFMVFSVVLYTHTQRPFMAKLAKIYPDLSLQF